jgi:hypothetical protein
MEEDTTLALVRKDLEPYGLVNIGDPDQDEPIVTLVHRMHAELEQLRNKVGTLERENTGRAALIKQHIIDYEALQAKLAREHEQEKPPTTDDIVAVRWVK